MACGMRRIGRYELVGILGEGGAGVVYDAVLPGPAGCRRPVAAKVLRENYYEIRREARRAGAGTRGRSMPARGIRPNRTGR